MANHFNLDEQVQVVQNVLHWKRRQFTNLQIEQLEAVERTLQSLIELRAGLIASKQEDGEEHVEEMTDEMVDGLIGLLHLQRA